MPQETRDALIAQLRRSEAHWQDVEVLLRRLASRLTYVADGRSAQLDTLLEDTRRQLREPAQPAALNLQLAALAESIKALDERQPAAPRRTADAAAAARLHGAVQVLMDLLDQLTLDQVADNLDEVRQALAKVQDEAGLSAQVETVARLINQHSQRVGEQKTTAEKLLQQVTDQLEEFVGYLTHENEARRAGIDSRQELDRNVVQEMRALSDAERAGVEPSALRQVVQSRIGAVAAHLKQFRQREEAREQDWQQRSENMSGRIAELERTTLALEDSLRQEQHLAATDRLTGVPNRLVFDQRIAQACASVTSGGPVASLLVLDIDRFKKINDAYGHAAGDRVLRVVAQQLLAQLRPEDLLARYGGEEFVAILSNTVGEEALHVGERLRQRIEQLGFHRQQEPIGVTLSCGITTLRPDDTPIVAFDRADQALYRAKRAGRNRCQQL